MREFAYKILSTDRMQDIGVMGQRRSTTALRRSWIGTTTARVFGMSKRAEKAAREALLAKIRESQRVSDAIVAGAPYSVKISFRSVLALDSFLANFEERGGNLYYIEEGARERMFVHFELLDDCEMAQNAAYECDGGNDISVERFLK